MTSSPFARLFLLIFTLGALLVPIQPQEAAAANSDINSTERAMLTHINNHRAARSLPALRIDGNLSKAAAWMSLDMAQKRYFSHTDSLGRSPQQRARYFGYTSTYVGENIAAGYPGAYDTFVQWRNSAGHNANMLNGNYRAIGIGRVCLTGSGYGCYWTTVFGNVYTMAPTYI